MLRALLLLMLLLPLPALARLAESVDGQPALQMQRDLPQIRASGVLRVLVNQSRHSSGQVRDSVIGVELQRLRAFEHALNDRQGVAPIRLQLLPTPKDRLLDALRRGEGDLVAPGELFDAPAGPLLSASQPIAADVPLVVVARQGNRRYTRLENLSGRVFALPAGSAAVPALKQLNRDLRARGLEPVEYEIMDASLAVEDVLELVHSGVVPLTVTELPIARRWASVYPRLRVDSHMILAKDGNLAWYVSRGAPNLLASVDRFLRHQPAASQTDAELRRLYRHGYRLQNPLGRIELTRLQRVGPVLRRHAEAQRLDWLMLAALAFKESTLDPRARGAGGASGLMQITPATARAVGVSDTASVDNNVLAASRYLARLRDRHFASARMQERERRAFVLAAYNMGPQRVQQMRAEARRRGLDADRWFFNVERIALEQMGMRGGNYVAAVNKYYLIYRRDRDYLER